jgi:hypothetical protein
MSDAAVCGDETAALAVIVQRGRPSPRRLESGSPESGIRGSASASSRSFDRQFAPIFGNFRGLRQERPIGQDSVARKEALNSQ